LNRFPESRLHSDAVRRLECSHQLVKKKINFLSGFIECKEKSTTINNKGAEKKKKNRRKVLTILFALVAIILKQEQYEFHHQTSIFVGVNSHCLYCLQQCSEFTTRT
jgi:hypothetical protein